MDEIIHDSPLIDEEGVREARVLEREKERGGYKSIFFLFSLNQTYLVEVVGIISPYDFEAISSSPTIYLYLRVIVIPLYPLLSSVNLYSWVG